MRIAILDGSPNAGGLSQYLESLDERLRSGGHEVRQFTLRNLMLRGCRGCWDCWVKTPGQCSRRDDGEQLLKAVINSDFALLASPIVLGFVSALLKQVQDRMITLIHPYIELVQGECHHAQRYTRYPTVGLLLERTEDRDEEDVAIIESIQRRAALNLKTPYAFTQLTTTAVEDLNDAIDGVQRLAARQA